MSKIWVVNLANTQDFCTKRTCQLDAPNLFCRFRQGMAGMSRDLGRDVPGSEKRCASKLSEVSKRGWRKGVGNKQTPKKSPKSSPEMPPLLLRGAIGKRVQKRGLNLWHLKDFLMPTPSICQPLFKTSETFGLIFLKGA